MARVLWAEVRPDVASPKVQSLSLGRVNVTETNGFSYNQEATTRSIAGLPPGLSVSARSPGDWSLVQDGHRQFGTGVEALTATDLTRPMRVSQSVEVVHRQAFFSADQLGLPVDLIRSGAGRVAHSPLAPLLTSHLFTLPGDGDQLSPETRSQLGDATVMLVRALLMSVSDGKVGVSDEMTDAGSVLVMKQYVTAHLRDPQLCPRAVASAHNISLRQLYNVWRDEPVPVARWILTQRLSSARDELVDPGRRRVPVAVIARASGFDSASHFSRTFKQAFGVSPREWRDCNRG